MTSTHEYFLRPRQVQVTYATSPHIPHELLHPAPIELRPPRPKPRWPHRIRRQVRDVLQKRQDIAHREQKVSQRTRRQRVQRAQQAAARHRPANAPNSDLDATLVPRQWRDASIVTMPDTSQTSPLPLVAAPPPLTAIPDLLERHAEREAYQQRCVDMADTVREASNMHSLAWLRDVKRFHVHGAHADHPHATHISQFVRYEHRCRLWSQWARRQRMRFWSEVTATHLHTFDAALNTYFQAMRSLPACHDFWTCSPTWISTWESIFDVGHIPLSSGVTGSISGQRVTFFMLGYIPLCTRPCAAKKSSQKFWFHKFAPKLVHLGF